MTYSTKLSLACTTALIALGGAASAQSVTIGITQNNVGVDSYQTTYEQAFIAAAEENPMSRSSFWMRAATWPARSRRSRTSSSRTSTR
jgi:hypothetical protein